MLELLRQHGASSSIPCMVNPTLWKGYPSICLYSSTCCSRVGLKQKLQAANTQCKQLKGQVLDLKKQLYAATSPGAAADRRYGGFATGAENTLSPNHHSGHGWGPRRGWAEEPPPYEPPDAHHADVTKRTLEAVRVQLRTQQAERLRCERELRQVRSKVDGLKAACDAATAARSHAEEQLDVQKVAAQAMLTRLQSRAAECSALQRQLSARAIELVHARAES